MASPGVAWHGMARHGLAWLGIAWHRVAWHGMACHRNALETLWRGLERSHVGPFPYNVFVILTISFKAPCSGVVWISKRSLFGFTLVYNRLPQHVVNATSIATFQQSLQFAIRSCLLQNCQRQSWRHLLSRSMSLGNAKSSLSVSLEEFLEKLPGV